MPGWVLGHLLSAAGSLRHPVPHGAGKRCPSPEGLPRGTAGGTGSQGGHRPCPNWGCPSLKLRHRRAGNAAPRPKILEVCSSNPPESARSVKVRDKESPGVTVCPLRAPKEQHPNPPRSVTPVPCTFSVSPFWKGSSSFSVAWKLYRATDSMAPGGLSERSRSRLGLAARGVLGSGLSARSGGAGGAGNRADVSACRGSTGALQRPQLPRCAEREGRAVPAHPGARGAVRRRMAAGFGVSSAVSGGQRPGLDGKRGSW